ncbi:BamA/TamA family outer membrane protein [Flavicella marina]|uniref:hypothetical protein n=1 Tax=Flavicella marina TaxID=1475951 RepID=UPI0012648DBF|nr:hypothetical protein [Flavicella marina]
MIFLNLLVGVFWNLNAQTQKVYLKIEQIDSVKIDFKNFNEIKPFYNSKEEINKTLTDFSTALNKEGHLSHTISLTPVNDSTYIAYTTINNRTENITLYFDSETPLPKLIKNREVSLKFNNIEKFISDLYAFYEKQGATFTQIKLQKFEYKNEHLSAYVDIQLSDIRTINKVVVKGYSNFPKKFITHYFQIKKNTRFNKNTLELTSNNINSLTFASETRRPEALFTKDSTYLYIYLKKKNTNLFDGMVGFSTEENGKLRFNGYLDLQLNNNFNKGEKLAVYWSNNGNDQEQFRFNLSTPYIFNSPLSPILNFEIYKQDSSFVNTDINLKLNYTLNRKNEFGASFLAKTSTNLLTSNSNPLIESYDKKLYGITYNFNYKKNIRTHYRASSAVSIGSNTSLNNKTPQYYAYLDLLLLEPISKRSSIFIHNRTETLRSETILQNELFILGGANTIRGFYEQSIFGSSYNFTNLEYRLLTDTASYIYTFTDVGFTEDQGLKTSQILYSFGLGYAYKTKGGFINLNYAFGKTNETNFDFGKGLFHVKLTTVF